jgi:hypothetical protein
MSKYYLLYLIHTYNTEMYNRGENLYSLPLDNTYIVYLRKLHMYKK